MADDLERASIADVSAENADADVPIDLDVLLFGHRSTEAIVADLDGESLTDDDEQEVDDGPAASAADANPGLEVIGGYRAEWRPSGAEDGGSDSFDPTDLRAGGGTSDGPDTSYGAGAIDARLRITDDVK